MEDSRGAHRVFGGKNLRERDHVEDTGIDGRIILKCMLNLLGGGEAWTGLIWLRIGTSSGLL
jgi:hypothetical protein